VLRLSWFALRAISATNRLILRRFTPAGLVLAALLVAAAVMGIDTERSTTYQVFALAAALFVAAALFLWRFRPQLTVTRVLPPLATAGEPCNYCVRLENRGVVAERGLIVEDHRADPRPTCAQFLRSGVPPNARSFIERRSGYARWRWIINRQGAIQLDSLHVDRLSPGQSIELAAQFTPARRGVLRFESVLLARPDPLGLVKACRDVHQPQHICILPRRYRLPKLTLPGARRYQQGGMALAASVGDSEEFVSLREYRPGDPLKRVHWRSFARTGKPVVKEFQDEFFERHCLVLDTFVGPEREAAFEAAVSVAASFVCAIDTHECLLDLLFVGDRPVAFTSGRGLLEPERLLELLAGAQPTNDRPFTELAAELLGRRAELTSAILVFAQWDDTRNDLCKRLIALDVPLMALAIVNPGERPDPVPAWLRVLDVGRVEQDLARGLG
jgi:uncharacterized protein (DUF58 family)